MANNAVSLTAGRFFLTLTRFVVALVIVQRAGLEMLGEFTLVLSFVMIAEFLSDFGLGDIAVRQMSANRERADVTMGALAISKAVQGVVAAAVLWGALVLLDYPSHVVRSGLIAGAAVILYSGVQIYRAQFRARMQMGREMGAEATSAVIFLVAIWLSTGAGASLETLALCYVLSRAVNLVVAGCLAGGLPKIGLGHGFRPELRVLASSSLALGVSGLVVIVYDTMDVIALSRWSTAGEVGIFTMAMRIMLLAVVVEQALVTAVFPVLARQWAQDRDSCARTLQTVLDWGMVLGGALFCALYAGSLGLAAFAKQDPHAIAAVLQLLSWAVLARVITTLIGPMVIVSGQLHYAVWIQAIIATAKWIALMALAQEGAMGAAVACLIAEIGIGLLPAVFFCQSAAGIWLKWSISLKVLLSAAIVAWSVRTLELDGSLLHGALASLVYLILASALGAVRVQPLRNMLIDIGNR